MPARRQRDIEKVYSSKKFAAKLRRLADALEAGQAFTIQVAGERLRLPASAAIGVEHERAEGVSDRLSCARPD
jgi:amphi-Trp domain-containing protein